MAMDTTQAMELTQATQTLKWLDEERRKDKATIATLQEQIQGQEKRLAQQASQIQDLQTTLTSVQSVLSRATEFEQMVSGYKKEIGFLIEQRDEEWKRKRAESNRLREIEMEAVSKHLSRLDKDLKVLPRYDEELEALRAEKQRLNESVQRLESSVSDLSQRSDDRIQAVTYLEEQRRADNRRIVGLERETTELHKRVEAQMTKLPLLEEKIQKQKPLIDEAVQQIKEFGQSIEDLRVSDFQREQKMKRYMDQGEDVSQQMEQVREQTQRFLEQYQLNERALKTLESFRSRQEKRQNEVSEMQRLAENRIRRQWEEWQTEQEKGVKKRQMVAGEKWKEQNKINQEFTRRFEPIEEQVELHWGQIEALLDARRLDAHRELEIVQDDVAREEEALTQAREKLSAMGSKE